jgi:hypothetical protein
MLDPGEVTTTTFVCNGVNGTNGANGLATLVSIVSEPVGTNCQYGGQMVTAGPDNNNNGVLDSSEVTSAKYVCNGTTGPTGPAGPGITWLDVTTSITATSNMGYMADSVSRVAITLPPAPTVGDVVQVSGAGTGGWNIGQNAGQSIITKNLPNIGAVWTARDSARAWKSVASSSDGTRLVAVVNWGQIYTSTDSGLTWTARDSARIWLSVASSSDGTRLVAVEYSGQIYTSIPSAVQSTTVGTAGSISGEQYAAIELQYIGNNTFTVLSNEGYLTVK